MTTVNVRVYTRAPYPAHGSHLIASEMATPSEPIAIPTTGLPVFEASPEERALQKCYTDLCDNLDAKAVLPHLYEECAISKRTYRDLRAKLGCDPSSAVEDFLLSLNSRAVRALCAVLLQTEETRDLGVRLQGGESLQFTTE